MSGLRESYIAEDVHELVADKVTEVLNNDNWQLDVKPWYGDKDIQRIITIDILDYETEEKIGSVTVENEPTMIEDTIGNDFLDWEPKCIIEIKKGDEILFQNKK